MDSAAEHSGHVLRSLAIDAAFRSASKRMPGVSHQEFLRATEDWEVFPLSAVGKICGALLINGAEVHACVEAWAHKRWVSKAVLKKFRDVTEEHGYCLTRVGLEMEQGHKFVAQLGFEPVRIHGDSVIYYRRAYGN